MRSPGVGAWRGASSLGCGSAIAEIAGCVHRSDADGRPMPVDGALTRRRHKGYRLINTNILLQSIRRRCGLRIWGIPYQWFKASS